MKKEIYLLALAMFVYCVQTKAQSTVVIPTSVHLDKNTEGGAAIGISFDLDMGTEEIDFDYWVKPENHPTFSIYYGDVKDADCKIVTHFQASKKGFGFKLTGFSQNTLDRFLNAKDNQIKLVVESDIKVKLMKQAGRTNDTFWVIEADEANKLMNEQLTFTDDDKKDFLTKLNNFYYYENKVDFGIQPGHDSINSTYFLSLQFQNTYNKKRFLSCKPNSSKSPAILYWSVDTRLSTDFSDSLNYIKIYPINILFEKFNGKVPIQANLKLGNESSQNFENKRVTVNGELNFIIPNLVNLTTAQSNRLRLKPVVTFGVKGYYDYSNGIDAFSSGQAYLNGHYYIPVFNNYAIIFDGGAFYDVSHERNPNKKILGNYSITLGAEIPKTGFKAMFKYVNGKTDINFAKGSVISLGLLMDFFQEKNSIANKN